MRSLRVRRALLASCLVAGLIFVCMAWCVGGSLVAPATRHVGPPPRGLSIETTVIESESGSTLATWYIPCHRATATCVLFHPFRADRRSMLGRARLLHEAGYAIVLFDFQAHGESPGEQITIGYRERLDGIAAVKFAREKNPHHKIGVIGQSLGGAAALLASPLQIDALVVESVYPTIEEAVHNRVAIRVGALSHAITPALLIQLYPRLGISRAQLRPIKHIPRVGCPVLVASGDRDCHTTLSETQRLYAAAQQPKQLVVFTGATHCDLLAYDPARYETIVKFLDRHLKSEADN